MLYNPNWQPRKAPKPWTLDHLIQWLETKEGQYSYIDSRNCMIAQYAKDLGYKGVWVTADRIYYSPLGLKWLPVIYKNLPKHFNEIARFSNGTFKNALEKAKVIRTSVSPTPRPLGRHEASSGPLERIA